MARPNTARKTTPRMSHTWGAPMGTSNQMVRRISSSSAPEPGFLIGGSASINGMNIRTVKMLTTENSSDIRERGRLQWLLVNRKATAAKGAAPATMNRNEKMAA